MLDVASLVAGGLFWVALLWLTYVHGRRAAPLAPLGRPRADACMLSAMVQFATTAEVTALEAGVALPIDGIAIAIVIGIPR